MKMDECELCQALVNLISKLLTEAELAEDCEATLLGGVVGAFFMSMEPERRHRNLTAWLRALTTGLLAQEAQEAAAGAEHAHVH